LHEHFLDSFGLDFRLYFGADFIFVREAKEHLHRLGNALQVAIVGFDALSLAPLALLLLDRGKLAKAWQATAIFIEQFSYRRPIFKVLGVCFLTKVDK